MILSVRIHMIVYISNQNDEVNVVSSFLLRGKAA